MPSYNPTSLGGKQMRQQELVLFSNQLQQQQQQQQTAATLPVRGHVGISRETSPLEEELLALRLQAMRNRLTESSIEDQEAASANKAASEHAKASADILKEDSLPPQTTTAKKPSPLHKSESHSEPVSKEVSQSEASTLLPEKGDDLNLGSVTRSKRSVSANQISGSPRCNEVIMKSSQGEDACRKLQSVI